MTSPAASFDHEVRSRRRSEGGADGDASTKVASCSLISLRRASVQRGCLRIWSEASTIVSTREGIGELTGQLNADGATADDHDRAEHAKVLVELLEAPWRQGDGRYLAGKSEVGAT